MKIVSLRTAVTEIHQAVEQRAFFNPPLASPFFFIVGAGVSHPPIPLASSIENYCRSEAAKYKVSPPPPTNNSLGTYSYWFEQAFPNAEARQHYLRGLMENASISNANFRLAHLLLDKKLASIVVTPNFDDFLMRALVLFGRRPVVCDHPQTLERISVESRDIQIIHVHGSYWFYDCCNLAGEIGDRAQRSSDESFSTRSGLDEILRFRSPLVIGYSGWEGDVIMNALKHRLSSRLGNNWYWFCHKKSDLDLLPPWLKVPGVCFVVPDDHDSQSGDDLRISLRSRSQGDELDEDPPNETGEGLSDTKPTTLAATDVLDALIKKFELPVPALTSDPLAFFSQQLRDSLLVGSDSVIDKDIYQIRNVIERIEKARKAERLTTRSTTDLLLEDLRNAVRKSDYKSAVSIAGNIDLAGLGARALRDAMSILANAADALTMDDQAEDNEADKIKLYDVIVASGEQLLSRNLLSTKDKMRWINALIDKGIAYAHVGKGTEQIDIFNSAVSQFRDETKPRLRETVAKAFFFRALYLMDLRDYSQAIQDLEEVCDRLKDSVDEDSQLIMAASLSNKGSCLTFMGTTDLALQAFNELIARFRSSSVVQIQDRVATAMLRKGGSLERSGRLREALEAYSELLNSFGDSRDPDIVETVCAGMVDKAVLLGNLGQTDECIALHEEVILAYGEYSDFSIRYEVARSLDFLAGTLSKLNRPDESIAAYDRLITRQAGMSELGMQRYLAMALIGKATELLKQGKKKEALETSKEVIDRFGDFTDSNLLFQVSRSMMLSASLMDTDIEKAAVYDRIVARFGDATQSSIRRQVEMARSLRKDLNI